MLHLSNTEFCTLEEAEVYKYPRAGEFFKKNRDDLHNDAPLKTAKEHTKTLGRFWNAVRII